MRRQVGGVVGVQQIQFGPAHINFPRAHPDGRLRQMQRNAQPLANCVAKRFDGQLPRIVERIKRLLKAIAIDVLAEISLLIKEANPDDWDAQITSRLQQVSRHIAQPPRVDWDRLAQHEFHAEVSDAGKRRSGMRRLKPRWPTFHHTFFAEHLVCLLAKNGVSKRVLGRLSRNGLKHYPGIVCQSPQFRLEPSPKFVGRVIPAPAQIQR